MVKKLVVAFGLMLLVAGGGIVGQVSDPARTEKELARVLSANARWIRSVLVRECKLTFSRPSFGGESSQYPSYAGGGFPRDEASNYLSAGADRSLLGRKAKVEIDLRAFDNVAISMKPAVRMKNFTTIWLAADDINKVMTVMPKDGFSADGVGFLVRNKDAERTAALLEKAIADCR